MPVPIPCLGYPTRSAAALALRGQGLSNAEIAERIGITAKQASCFVYRATHKRSSRPYDRRTHAVRISRDVIEDLGPHAAKRGLHPHALARLIVATVVDDEMIDAVLDDS